MSQIHVGCCGFRSSKKEYFKIFSLVEIQHTFYQPPQLKTLQGWRNEAPENFEFTIKAWQRITHHGASRTYKRVRKQLSDHEKDLCGSFMPTSMVSDAMEVTLACAETLKAKKILFQCPAVFIPSEENVENLTRFFKKFSPPAGVEFLWEPRGKWPDALVYELCDQLKLTHVVNPFERTPITSDPYYYRIHGRKKPYSDEEILDLVETARIGKETYVLFNNVQMVQDAKRFKFQLG